MRINIHVNIQTKVAMLLALALTLSVVGSAAAQGSEPPPCSGESVAGTVVAVDEETGVVTLDTGGDLCTVTLGDGYDHPIVALLGSYFGDVSIEALAAALETTQGCAVQDTDSGEWAWADCSAAGAVPVTVVGENKDGTFAAIATVGTAAVNITVTVEGPAAESLSEALQTLNVEWRLDESGGVVQVGSEIAAYHEDGLGFGVLVKLYAMAAASQKVCAQEESTEPCGVTVEELVEAFQSGMGMGELFKEYGKPSVLGVGHARQQTKEHMGGPPDHAGPKDRTSPSDDVDLEQDLTGPPDHAGPKDNHGPPAHAGPKKPKKNK